MKRVPQKDKKGCGVACVAMLAGKTYAQARRLLHPNGSVEETRIGDLRRVLAESGVQCSPRQIAFKNGSIEDLPFDALVKINPKEGGLFWHWVVWDHARKVVLDSRDPPYRHRRPIAYYKITRAEDA